MRPKTHKSLRIVCKSTYYIVCSLITYFIIIIRKTYEAYESSKYPLTCVTDKSKYEFFITLCPKLHRGTLGNILRKHTLILIRLEYEMLI